MTTTTISPPGRHRLPVPPALVPAEYLLAQDLGTDVQAWFAPVDATQCGWCSQDGHDTTVQVTGWPREELTDPRVTVAMCCQCCAGYVVDVARSEQAHGDDRDIRVEFGVSREVSQ
jgi:hypothetical protein